MRKNNYGAALFLGGFGIGLILSFVTLNSLGSLRGTSGDLIPFNAKQAAELTKESSRKDWLSSIELECKLGQGGFQTRRLISQDDKTYLESLGYKVERILESGRASTIISW